MSIQITPAASDRMRAFLAKAPEAAGVRFAVKRMGCSGFGYVVDLAGAVGPEDQVLDIDGIRVVVDPKSLILVDGPVLEFPAAAWDAFVVAVREHRYDRPPDHGPSA